MRISYAESALSTESRPIGAVSKKTPLCAVWPYYCSTVLVSHYRLTSCSVLSS